MQSIICLLCYLLIISYNFFRLSCLYNLLFCMNAKTSTLPQCLMVTIVILNMYFDSYSFSNRDTANLFQGQNSNHTIPVGWGLQLPFGGLIDACGSDKTELGYSNHSSESCDCHNMLFPLKKKIHSCSAKCIMQICALSFQYGQGRTQRVNSLGKTCSHCYLLSLSFLQIVLPIKTFSPESKRDSKQGCKAHLKKGLHFYLPSINKCPGVLNPLCIVKSVQQMTEDKRER